MSLDKLTPWDGASTASLGTSYHVAQFKSGKKFNIFQENYNTKTNYYSDLFIYHLEDEIANLKLAGNPLSRILELGIGRGILSVGIALLTDDKTQIIGVDIQANNIDVVKKNARLNGVESKIEVRPGDLFSPIQLSEKFDLIVFDLPHIPVDPITYRVQLSKNDPEFININGGPDGKYFINKVITSAPQYLNKNGALLFTHPSFTNIEKTLNLLATNQFKGSVVASKNKLLDETKFTKENRKYIEDTCGYIFQDNPEGKTFFSINIVEGIFHGK